MEAALLRCFQLLFLTRVKDVKTKPHETSLSLFHLFCIPPAASCFIYTVCVCLHLQILCLHIHEFIHCTLCALYVRHTFFKLLLIFLFLSHLLHLYVILFQSLGSLLRSEVSCTLQTYSCRYFFSFYRN